MVHTLKKNRLFLLCNILIDNQGNITYFMSYSLYGYMKINPMTYVNINNKTKVKIVEIFFYVIRWRALFNFIIFFFWQCHLPSNPHELPCKGFILMFINHTLKQCLLENDNSYINVHVEFFWGYKIWCFCNIRNSCIINLYIEVRGK